MTQDISAMRPRHPSLYRLADDGRSLNFLFAQCPRCQELSFPANTPGCMHCGEPLSQADQVVRAGGGTLLEYVTVHVPMVPGQSVPTISGDIRIADNIVQEGVVGVDDEAKLHPGMALKAVAMPLTGSDIYDCRFVPASTGDAR